MASFLSTHPGMTTGPAGLVPSAKLFEFLKLNGKPKDEDRAKALLYLHDKCCTPKVDRELIVREIARKKYFIEHEHHPSTPKRIFKMLERKHADSLCERGCVGLGPLNYYTAVENKEIEDKHEGIFVVYAEGQRYSVLAATGVGSHVLVYCTTTDSTKNFGNDACVEIRQPEAFSAEIAKAITAKFKGKNELARVEQSNCVYQCSRVIAGRLQGFAEELVHLNELSVNTIDVITDKKYLIKEITHAGDSEYRFAFVMKADVPDYAVIESAELTKYCRRVR